MTSVSEVVSTYGLLRRIGKNVACLINKHRMAPENDRISFQIENGSSSTKTTVCQRDASVEYCVGVRSRMDTKSVASNSRRYFLNDTKDFTFLCQRMTTPASFYLFCKFFRNPHFCKNAGYDTKTVTIRQKRFITVAEYRVRCP